MRVNGFAFGKNWQTFVRTQLNEQRIEQAKKSLMEFCGDQSLIREKRFLDVGCGSGLFSLAAFQLGASRILSFDVDPYSVKCCEYLRERAGNPANWKILQGSILDEEFVSHLGKYDFVYSWGVLHHTGDMWKSLENTTRLVAKGGFLYVAIYNRADGLAIYSDGRFGSSNFWLKVKKFYSSSPSFLQDLIDHSVKSVLILSYIVALRNPVRKINDYANMRGMSWGTDIRDWLGGYPYEFACVDEVFNFVRRCGFYLENLKCANGLRNNEYLFRKA